MQWKKHCQYFKSLCLNSGLLSQSQSQRNGIILITAYIPVSVLSHCWLFSTLDTVPLPRGLVALVDEDSGIESTLLVPAVTKIPALFGNSPTFSSFTLSLSVLQQKFFLLLLMSVASVSFCSLISNLLFSRSVPKLLFYIVPASTSCKLPFLYWSNTVLYNYTKLSNISLYKFMIINVFLWDGNYTAKVASSLKEKTNFD